MYTVEIKNIKEVQRALSKYPMIATKHIDKAIKLSIYKTQEKSKQRTPVDTGYLRRSHSTMFQPLRGILEPMAEYAGFVEFGTKKMKAQPYLGPALEQADSEIQGYFQRAVRDTMDEVARSV